MIEKRDSLSVSFWGTRGSFPCSGVYFTQYGGHTSCVTCEAEDQLIIFDAGSGLMSLSSYLSTQPYKVAHLFLTHFHLDHLLGFPFFPQNRNSDFELNLYCGTLKEYGGLEYNLRNFIKPPLFPFTLDDFTASLKFHDIKSRTFLKITDRLQLHTMKLNHPNGSMGYKLNFKDKILCYITDTEYKLKTISQEFLNFINNAALVIFDTSYTDEEYPDFEGWGHSTWQEAIKICQSANVRQLAFFHHSPDHTDAKLGIIHQKALKRWSRVITAYDGLKIEI